MSDDAGSTGGGVDLAGADVLDLPASDHVYEGTIHDTAPVEHHTSYHGDGQYHAELKNNGLANWDPPKPERKKHNHGIVSDPAVASSDTSISSIGKRTTRDSSGSLGKSDIPSEGRSRRKSSTVTSKASTPISPLQPSQLNPARSGKKKKNVEETPVPKKSSHSTRKPERDGPPMRKGRTRGFSFDSSSLESNLPIVSRPKHRTTNNASRREKEKPIPTVPVPEPSRPKPKTTDNAPRRTKPTGVVSPPVSSASKPRENREASKKERTKRGVGDWLPDSDLTEYPRSDATSVLYGARSDRSESSFADKAPSRRRTVRAPPTTPAQKPEVKERVSSKAGTGTAIDTSRRRRRGEEEKTERPERPKGSKRTISEESARALSSTPTQRPDVNSRSVTDIDKGRHRRHRGQEEKSERPKRSKGTVSEEIIHRNFLGLRKKTTTITRDVYDSDEWREINSKHSKQKLRKKREEL